MREEEIEAAHQEQVQKRSATLLASKASKFAAIHTERLKAFRQLSAAKVRAAELSAQALWYDPAPSVSH